MMMYSLRWFLVYTLQTDTRFDSMATNSSSCVQLRIISFIEGEVLPYTGQNQSNVGRSREREYDFVYAQKYAP